MKSAIVPAEIPALSADHKRVHSVWTTDGRVADVGEPYALELRTDERTAKALGVPEEIALEGPILAHRSGSMLTVQECARHGAADGASCVPSGPEISLPLDLVRQAEVTMPEQREAELTRSSPYRPNRAWIAAVVLGGGAAIAAAVLAVQQLPVYGGH